MNAIIKSLANQLKTKSVSIILGLCREGNGCLYLRLDPQNINSAKSGFFTTYLGSDGGYGWS